MVESIVTKAPAKPEAMKKLVVRIEQDSSIQAKFTVKDGEIPVTRRDLNLILRAIKVEYGRYSRGLLIQQSLKQKAQGVTDAVA